MTNSVSRNELVDNLPDISTNVIPKPIEEVIFDFANIVFPNSEYIVKENDSYIISNELRTYVNHFRNVFNRSQLPPPKEIYIDQESALVYSLTYFCRYFFRTHFILNNLIKYSGVELNNIFPKKIRVLDIGTGPTTFPLSFIDYYCKLNQNLGGDFQMDSKIHFDCIEQNGLFSMLCKYYSKRFFQNNKVGLNLFRKEIPMPLNFHGLNLEAPYDFITLFNFLRLFKPT